MSVEITLEFRAAGRGFVTHLFGQPSAVNPSADETAASAYGPTTDFPFRSRIVDAQKDNNTIRIWIASSSHAEDIRMAVPDLFPSVLERELDRRGVDCEVLNASRAGMTLEQNATELASLASTWTPDIVIAYQMSNDLSANFYVGDTMNKNTTKAIPQGLPKLTEQVDRFVEQTTLYELLKSNITARITKERILRSDVEQASENHYFQQLKQLQTTATTSNAKFFVCTFGFSHIQSDLPVDYELVLLKTLPDLKPSAWRNVVHRWNQGIRDRHPVCTLDVGTATAKKPELFRDPVHFSKAGHEWVGQTIANELLKHCEFLKSGVAPTP